MISNIKHEYVKHHKIEKLECYEKIFGASQPKESGSWRDAGKLTVINEAGVLYSSPVITPTATLPDSPKITQVVWKLDITNHQEGLVIYLCDIYQHPGWLDISTRLSGRTKAFNNRCANHHFKLYFYVMGDEVLNESIFVHLDSIDVIWG